MKIYEFMTRNKNLKTYKMLRMIIVFFLKNIMHIIDPSIVSGVTLCPNSYPEGENVSMVILNYSFSTIYFLRGSVKKH